MQISSKHRKAQKVVDGAEAYSTQSSCPARYLPKDTPGDEVPRTSGTVSYRSVWILSFVVSTILSQEKVFPFWGMHRTMTNINEWDVFFFLFREEEVREFEHCKVHIYILHMLTLKAHRSKIGPESGCMASFGCRQIVQKHYPLHKRGSVRWLGPGGMNVANLLSYLFQYISMKFELVMFEILWRKKGAAAGSFFLDSDDLCR